MTILQKAIAMVAVLPWLADEFENLLSDPDFVVPSNYKNLPKKIESLIEVIRQADDRIIRNASSVLIPQENGVDAPIDASVLFEDQITLNRNLRMFLIDIINTDDKFESKNAFLSQKQRYVLLTIGVEYFAKALSTLKIDPRFKRNYYDPTLADTLLKIAYTIKKIIILPNKKEEIQFFHGEITKFLEDIISDED